MNDELANDILAITRVFRAVVNDFIVESLAELVGAESVRRRELVEQVSKSRDSHFHVVTIPQPKTKVKHFLLFFYLFFLNFLLDTTLRVKCCNSLSLKDLQLRGGAAAVTP